MNDQFDLRITPEPSPEDREAILAVVEQTLRREASLSVPSAWRLSGWVNARAGITDVGRWIEPQRRWSLSAIVPPGGRVYSGLNGRGDAK